MMTCTMVGFGVSEAMQSSGFSIEKKREKRDRMKSVSGIECKSQYTERPNKESMFRQATIAVLLFNMCHAQKGSL